MLDDAALPAGVEPNARSMVAHVTEVRARLRGATPRFVVVDEVPDIPAVPAAAPADASSGAPVLCGAVLDPRFTFATFVTAPSNILPHAAARQVSDAEAGAGALFNPLVIHGDCGLGKTHLLQAAARAMHWRGHKVLYLTADRFMAQFSAAMKDREAFRRELRALDGLFIDDLQFLTGPHFQREFCLMLNTLLDAGRQVVLATDRPPGELDVFDDRVRSRLLGGLVAEVAPLDAALRLKILTTRAAALSQAHAGFTIPAPVLEMLAHAMGGGGREIEGVLNRLLVETALVGAPVTLDLAEGIARALAQPAEPRRVRVEDVIRVVAKHHNVSRDDILSQRRTANVVKPRQIAMYLAKTLTLRSLPEIGRRFGGRDHTTVLHAVRKIDGLLGTDSALAREIEVLKRLVGEA